MATRKTDVHERRTGVGRSIDVTADDGEWKVRSDRPHRPTEVYRTQDEAISAAREKLRLTGGEVRVHGKNGRITRAVTLGRRAMAKVSAVEGISLGDDIMRDLSSYDREGLRPDERRRRIKSQYALPRKK